MSKQFGSYLRRRREKLLAAHPMFSVRQVAKRVGLEPSYLSKIERGLQPPPSEDTIRKIAAELREDSDMLLGLAGKVSKDLWTIVRKRPGIFSQLIRSLRDVPDQALLKIIRDYGG